MAGPVATEAELVAIWVAAVDVLEVFRVHADDTQAVGATGKLQVLEEALTGDYPPAPVAEAASQFRAGLSGLLSVETIRGFIDPILREYALIIDTDAADTYGGAFTDSNAILDAMYDFFVAQGVGAPPATTVESRQITFDSTPTYGSANVGAGKLSRLTVDENAYELEACHVEKKHFKCVQDANTGVLEEAEVFQHLGSARSKDNLRATDHGSGSFSATTIISKHAGGGAGGSILDNSSFQDFTATNNPKFTNWVETFGGAAVTADITSSSTVYRSFPGESTAGALSLSMAMNASGDTITLKQTLDTMNQQRLRRDRPYFLRVMVRDGGSAAGGNLALRLGSQAVTLAVSSLTTSFQELIIPLDENCWFANFNQDTLDVEIEWAGGTAGTVLWDDMIFAEMDLIDGTYWVIRQNQATATRWLVDDTIDVEDTSTIGNGKLQYYLFKGYGRYLPHATTSSITDP